MRLTSFFSAVLFLSAGTAGAADPAVLARGELLFHIGGCTNCHTAKDGPLLGGGAPLATPFGTFHPPNITPDPTHGIGGWTDEQFIRAMREGVAPDGSPYYPAFPYTSYTRMTDDDLRAMKAWLDTVPPSDRPSPAHELGFPYNQRWAMRFWQMLFFTPERYAPDPAQSESWNRGAYLVLGPGHCGECHTPRNAMGVLQWDQAFAGGDLGGPSGRVPNISGNPERGLGDWSEGDVVTALTIGMMPDGDFLGGEMGMIVANGTAKLPPEDVQAIATYLKSLPPR